MIGRDGFACLGRVTLADCALVPALFYLENVLPSRGLADPIAANANVAAYWAAIQRDEYAARILVELHRGLEERRELIRSGAIEKIRAATRAAREAAERGLARDVALGRKLLSSALLPAKSGLSERSARANPNQAAGGLCAKRTSAMG